MKHRHHLHILIILGLIGLILIFLTGNYILQKRNLQQKVVFGVSYSPEYASFLGLDSKLTYQKLFTQLNVKKVRLAAYWDQIEPEKDNFNFSDLDYYINEAQKNQAEVILAVGHKLPRWPECRSPKWLDTSNISFLRERQLKMLQSVVNYYNQNSTVKIFQLENEPLLEFGLCPKPDRDFLKKELEVVKKLTDKEVMITDSGELRSWLSPMRLSDIFGTTLYKKVGNPIFGQIYYPFPPWLYSIKAEVIRKLSGSNVKKIIISELQGELWATKSVHEIPVKEQIKTFSIKDFQNAATFARQTGFPEILLWGAEWWYYMAENGHPQYLEYARELF